MYPDNSTEKFDFELFDKEKIDKKTKEKLEIRQKLLQDLRCPVC